MASTPLKTSILSDSSHQPSGSDYSPNNMPTGEDEDITLLASGSINPLAYPPHLAGTTEDEDFLSSSRLKRFSNMILYSHHYLVFYSLVMMLQLGMFFFAAIRTRWFRDTLVHMPSWYVILDVVVIVLMCLELMLRLTAAGKRFFRKMTNRCDIVLVSFCVATLPLYFVHHTTIYVALLLTLARYSSQLVRLVLMIRLQVKRAKMADIASTTVSLRYDTFLPHTINDGPPRSTPSPGLSTDNVHAYAENMFATNMGYTPHASLRMPTEVQDSDSDDYLFVDNNTGTPTYDLYDKRIARGIAALSASYRSTSSHIPQQNGICAGTGMATGADSGIDGKPNANGGYASKSGSPQGGVAVAHIPGPVLIAAAPIPTLTPSSSLGAGASAGNLGSYRERSDRNFVNGSMNVNRLKEEKIVVLASAPALLPRVDIDGSS